MAAAAARSFNQFTMAMPQFGNDPAAVVDMRLQVRGITGLRVADCSIMPTITSGNTNAPAIMIGEKLAEMILQARGVGNFVPKSPPATA